ncbi:hypothetical protein Aduo_017347 [Ancylostoma duodenale]
MHSFYYLLPILLASAQRSFASFPTDIIEEEPAAVAPEPPTQVFVGSANAAPVMSQIPAPAVYHPPGYPHALYHDYYHPRTEVRNVVKGYTKEIGHRSETSVVSEDGHLPSAWGLHPAQHLPEALAFPVPFRSRLHRKKMAKKAKKASRARKTNKRN